MKTIILSDAERDTLIASVHALATIFKWSQKQTKEMRATIALSERLTRIHQIMIAQNEGTEIPTQSRIMGGPVLEIDR
jgi:hypothetical protein